MSGEDTGSVCNDSTSPYFTKAKEVGKDNPVMITKGCEALVDVSPANCLPASGRN